MTVRAGVREVQTDAGVSGTLVRTLDTQRDRVAATKAERRQSCARSAVLHRVEQRGQHARAARSDWMSERDRATVYIHALPVPAETRTVGNCLRGKRFVCFDEVEVANALPGFLHQVLHGEDRGEEQLFRLGGAGRVRGNATENLESVRLCVLFRDDDAGGRTVVQTRRVARGYREISIVALPGKGRPQLGERVHRRVLPRTLVGVHDRRALLRRDLYGDNLVLEPAGLDGLDRFPV